MQIKKKMTREEFVRNNRGINGPKDNPQDLPQEFLTELYNHFSEKAIRFPQLPATLSQKEAAADHTVIKCACIPPTQGAVLVLAYCFVWHAQCLLIIELHSYQVWRGCSSLSQEGSRALSKNRLDVHHLAVQGSSTGCYTTSLSDFPKMVS